MFPNKIKITDDLIDLIIETRKAHDLTAYQLSEQIGKNKSWLPNIENKRTKNVSREDLYLLFNAFAEKEDLRPEQYIVKHLPRNSMIELEDGVTAPCYHVREMLDVCVWEEDSTLSLEQFNEEMDFNAEQRSDALKQKDVQASIYRLSTMLEQKLTHYSLDKQEDFTRLIDTMSYNIENDFERTLSLYGNSYCPTDPLEHDTKVKQVFLSQLDLLQDACDSAITMMITRAFVYSFIEETPFDTYRFFDKIRNWNSLTEPEDEKLYFALEDIKNYHFGVYSYIEDCEKYSTIFKNNIEIDYQLLFAKLHEMFTVYINVAKINYSFDFPIPDSSTNKSEIEELHRTTDKILFDIEKELRSKFRNRNSWCFS